MFYDIKIYDIIIQETLNSVDIIFDFDVTSNKEFFLFSEELFKFVYLDTNMFKFYKKTLMDKLKESKKEIEEMLENKKYTVPSNRIRRIIYNKSFKIIISLGRYDLEDIEKQIETFSFSEF